MNINKMPEREERLRSVFSEIKEESTPKVDSFSRSLRAFIVGGSICVAAQVFRGYVENYFDETEAGIYTTIMLIFVTAVLTSIGVFDKIGRFAGAGSYVPITGFANSIVSSAIEFRSEGMIFGVGALMFKVAGPVIVSGIVSSWLVGIIYFFMNFKR
ncbi:MAG: SpoVA/SpoVAEb family sporulation membrane protein [Eubacteriaceae bacterium]|nr:SpoVA/SpoVAEb family sporulation membrane protein [Eubacteriaceae bacterium]